MCCDQNSHCIPPVDFTNSCAERTHTPPPQTQAQLKLSQRVTGESSYSSPGRNLNVCKVCFCLHRSSIMDIKEYIQKMSVSERQLTAEVSNLLQLLLVMPATNAISERSFSALRRVKNYLRSSMTQERLNHLLLLHAHKQLTDLIDLIAVANDFVSLSEHRLSLLGKFSEADILPIAFCGKCIALLKCSSCNC